MTDAPDQDKLLFHLAAAVREARETAKIKRSHVAAAADMDQSAVSRFESGSAWPRNPDRLIGAYAQVLNVTADALWGDAMRRWKHARDEA